MALSIATIRSHRPGQKTMNTRSHMTTFMVMRHVEVEDADPISAPGTACFIVLSISVICAGILLICLGFVGANGAITLKVIGPILFVLGVIGVLGSCRYVTKMKQRKRELEMKDVAAIPGTSKQENRLGVPESVTGQQKVDADMGTDMTTVCQSVEPGVSATGGVLPSRHHDRPGTSGEGSHWGPPKASSGDVRRQQTISEDEIKADLSASFQTVVTPLPENYPPTESGFDS